MVDVKPALGKYPEWRPIVTRKCIGALQPYKDYDNWQMIG